MQPIRQTLVLILLRGVVRCVRREDEVQVREEEERYDGNGRAHGRVPVIPRAVGGDPREHDGDEDVDDEEGVRGQVEDEVVCVAGRRGEHDDEGYELVLGEAHERRVEQPVARPHAGEREDALAAELLDEAALGEDDRENVPEGGERDEEERVRSARMSKMLQKKDAARMRPELAISALGTTAK